MKVKEIAALFGYTGQWVKNRYDEGSIPKPVKGDIDFQAAAVGIVGYLKKLVERAEGARSELAKSRSGLAEEDRLLKQQKRLKMAGELVSKKDVELVWAARKAAVRQRIEQLPVSKKEKDEICEELAGSGIEEFLK